MTHTAISSGLLCSLAGALYTAAILFCGTQLGFLMRVMPWLLSSTSCVILDFLVSFYSKRDLSHLNCLEMFPRNVYNLILIQPVEAFIYSTKEKKLKLFETNLILKQPSEDGFNHLPSPF